MLFAMFSQIFATISAHATVCTEIEGICIFIALEEEILSA